MKPGVTYVRIAVGLQRPRLFFYVRRENAPVWADWLSRLGFSVWKAP